MKKIPRAGKKFDELVAILDALRGPEGCPWDRDQDERSIRDYFLEEVYETVEAIEAGRAENLAEELGDVLMEIVFLARIHQEKKRFTIVDVLDGIIRKMILRHPHVFGERRTLTAGRVADAWRKRKSAEKGRISVLEDAGAATPALSAAWMIGRRVSACGFDWPRVSEALDKVKEEIKELESALAKGRKREMAEETGDLLFAVANVSRKLGLNPEIALRRANRKFTERFRELEKAVAASGKSLKNLSLREMDEIWEKHKKKRACARKTTPDAGL